MEWFSIEKDEQILKSAIIGVGPLKAVKTSSGKGEELVERTVYNFTIRVGTGGVVLKSRDYSTLASAAEERSFLLS